MLKAEVEQVQAMIKNAVDALEKKLVAQFKKAAEPKEKHEAPKKK